MQVQDGKITEAEGRRGSKTKVGADDDDDDDDGHKMLANT